MPLHQGLSVFIIDDNEMTRSLLRVIIQGDKYDVVGDAGTAEGRGPGWPPCAPTSSAWMW